LHPKEYWGGAYGVASHTQVIKQADVMTMLYLFKDKYTAETVAANYDYYEPRTEHGSSLSACMYALTACLIGRPDAAYPLFLKSAQADLQSGGKEWAGFVYIGGTHPGSRRSIHDAFERFLGFESCLREPYTRAPAAQPLETCQAASLLPGQMACNRRKSINERAG
jgi:kojibiose phosphorylase/nigerose phosphorylase